MTAPVVAQGPEFDLLIVGNGAAAVALLGALDQQGRRSGARLRIGLMGPATALGRGSCYHEDSAALLLNSPAADMSVRPGAPDHFVEWLHGAGLAAAGRFVPRYLFGRYVRETAQALVAGSVHAITQVDDVADGIARASGTAPAGALFLVAGRTRTWRSRAVVLATGMAAPADQYALAGRPGYFAAPFPADAILRRVAPGGRVMILGSSLSAIDVAIVLAQGGVGGPVTLVSRQARLPAIKCVKVKPALPHTSAQVAAWRAQGATPDGIGMRAVLRCTRRDLRAIGFDWRTLFAPAMATSADSMAAQIAAAAAPVDWLNQVNAMQSALDPVWARVREHERARFIVRCMPDLLHKLAGIPAANAQRVHQLMQAGQLRNVAGVRSVRHDGAAFVATLADGATVTADYVVNATGPARRAEGALCQALLDGGLARRHAAGGLDCIAQSGALVGGHGAVVPHLYALGHLSCGVHPVINNMSAIVAKAGDLAPLLAPQERGGPARRGRPCRT